MSRRKRADRSSVSKEAIDASARALLEFLHRNRSEKLLRYPFSFSYPQNCCESVSLILTYLLEEKYELDNVTIIKGTKPRKHQHHLWVMVGALNYDLTAHQFPRRKPIIGVLAHSFFFTFPDWKVEYGRDFVAREEIIALYREGVIPF